MYGDAFLITGYSFNQRETYDIGVVRGHLGEFLVPGEHCLAWRLVYATFTDARGHALLEQGALGA